MRTFILLLVVAAPLACTATKCMADCTQFQINVPPKPESGYNTGKAVSAIFEGVMSILRAKTFGATANDLGYIGGGLFGGIWGATVEAQEEAKMQEYQLAKGLQQTQDYLACVMEAQVSGAVYQLNQRMDDDRINLFNSAIQGIVDWMGKSCPAHNCLNASDIEPSKRNAAMGVACLADYPVTNDSPSTCSNVTWDPFNVTLCTGKDVFGTKYDGVCGEDGRCYWSQVGFKGTIDDLTKVKDQFMAKDSINNFRAFDNLHNPTAVVAYAKGALVYLSILQELHLLGSPSAPDGEARVFANTAANWLKDRVYRHTNVSTTMVTVLDANQDNTFKQEPMAVRKSCRPGDVSASEPWLGTSRMSSVITLDTQFCLMKPDSMGMKHPQSLVMGVCDDANQQYNVGFDANRPQQMTLRKIGDKLSFVAAEMASDNRRLFLDAGVYSIIQSLEQMAVKSMPDNSFKFYQNIMTPRWLCSVSTPPLLRAAAPTVAPVTTREEPDNLSKGSVVLRGVVIGGEKMEQIKSRQRGAAAAAKPTQAKQPAAAPAKAKQPAGRRLRA